MRIGDVYCGMVLTKKEVVTKNCTRYYFSACVPEIMDEFGYAPGCVEFITFTVYQYPGIAPRYYIKRAWRETWHEKNIFTECPSHQVFISRASRFCRCMISHIKDDLSIRVYKGV